MLVVQEAYDHMTLQELVGEFTTAVFELFFYIIACTCNLKPGGGCF